MGIRFSCPNGHNLNVKTFLAGKRGVCPQCGAKFVIPIEAESQNTNAVQTRSLNPSLIVEAISPSAVQTTMANGSPSIMIQVADIEALHKPAQPQFTTNLPIAAVPPSPVTPVAAAGPPSFAKSRRQRQIQITVSALLFLLVVVLAIVLFIVMRRQFSQQTNPKKPAAATNH
jgi:tellurite resistance protein TehA-like permease